VGARLGVDLDVAVAESLVGAVVVDGGTGSVVRDLDAGDYRGGKTYFFFFLFAFFLPNRRSTTLSRTEARAVASGRESPMAFRRRTASS
jgi:hypothetical protein